MVAWQVCLNACRRGCNMSSLQRGITQLLLLGTQPAVGRCMAPPAVPTCAQHIRHVPVEQPLAAARAAALAAAAAAAAGKGGGRGACRLHLEHCLVEALQLDQHLRQRRGGSRRGSMGECPPPGAVPHTSQSHRHSQMARPDTQPGKHLVQRCCRCRYAHLRGGLQLDAAWVLPLQRRLEVEASKDGCTHMWAQGKHPW